MTEFAKHVNESVENACKGENHAGEEAVTYIPTPRGYRPTTHGIALDDIQLEKVEDGTIRGSGGTVVFDANAQNADLWRVSGKIRK